MAKLLLAKEVNEKLNAALKAQVAELAGKGITPTLAVIRLGANDDDISYERGIKKRSEALGVSLRSFVFEESISEDELLMQIDALNKDELVHGILIFKPLPKGFDEEKICNAIAPSKDVDSVTAASAIGIYTGKKSGFAPCTAESVMQILKAYELPLAGKKAVVIGRSQVIGKPVSLMLLSANATVTICHSKSEDVQSICKGADIIIAAAGVPKMINADYVSAGQCVIDVGIHFGDDGKMCGDVDFEAVEPIVAAITPVPGGVGGVTTTILLSHVIEAASK